MTTMNIEEFEEGHMACPPGNVNEWVDQQLAAIRAEAGQSPSGEHVVQVSHLP